MNATPDRAATFEAADDFDAINRLYRERRWSDGLPIVPPTAERVERMLAATKRPRHDVVAAALRMAQHAFDALDRRRNDRQPVAPAPLAVEPVDRVEVVRCLKCRCSCLGVHV